LAHDSRLSGHFGFAKRLPDWKIPLEAQESRCEEIRPGLYGLPTEEGAWRTQADRTNTIRGTGTTMGIFGDSFYCESAKNEEWLRLHYHLG